MTDEELVRDYALHRTEASFSALVARHLDLVYSVAHRQVRSAALAEEVAQMVFVDLARQAARLKPGTSIVAWLHVVARRTAIDLVRREARRRTREQQAAALSGNDPAMLPLPDDWPQVEPLLDEAVESLPPAQRTAILLRYFENKSLRDVGAALGISDDNAQKRVTRAVEQLRGFFLRRGIAVSAAGLATNLSAHALQTAPAGLVTSMSAFSVASALPQFAAAATAGALPLTMTVFQKVVVVASLAVALGGSVYHATAWVQQDEKRLLFESSTTDLRAEIARLRTEQAAATADLAHPTPAPGSDTALDKEMQAWTERAVQLKLLMAENPEFTIPEMDQYVTDTQIFELARSAPLKSELDLRRVLSALRTTARNRFNSDARTALQSYLKAHDNQLPAHPSNLAPYFSTPIDSAIFKRYRIAAGGQMDATDQTRRSASASMIEEIAVADTLFDLANKYSYNGSGGVPVDPLAKKTVAAWDAFGAANDNAVLKAPQDLLPFFKPPLNTQDEKTFFERAPRYFTPLKR